MEPTHPHWQVETATAPSAGGSPDPDGKAAQLPIRTNSIHVPRLVKR
ncbi:MAG: hypothetical protein ACOX52_05435 [Verrucomicrobiota bacterium]